MILAELNTLYDRLASRGEVPSFGYSVENISFELIIDRDGTPVEFNDLRRADGKKTRPRSMRVPTNPEISRTSAIYANPLWDKTSYALGCSANPSKRMADEHQAFIDRQKELFNEADDPSLEAFLAFLDQWEPGQISEIPRYTVDILDTNIVFRLDGEQVRVHDAPASQEIWQATLQSESQIIAQCLVTGAQAPVAAGHPRIRGVDGAQSSGAAIVSFNSNAYLSYGLDNAETAALSKPAVFAYATALNHLLRRGADNRHRLRIGDTTTVFWAIARDADAAEAAETFFAAANEPPSDEQENQRIHDVLSQVASGRPLAELSPDLDPDTRIVVLGLAPNAARLSIRFWCTERLDTLMERYRDHWQDLALDPPVWRGAAPTVWRLVNATAPSRDGKTKGDDVSPLLAGETMRAILTGRRYPRALLTNTIMRFRNDGDIGSPSHTGRLRIALCKAVLQRQARLAHSKSAESEISMSLDRDSTHPGYLLGRLFAELENAQRTALGRVNASIKDRYFGSASATPASVFPILVRNAQHHLSNIRKGDRPGLAHHIEAEIGHIIDGLGGTFPKHLGIEAQGRFAIGYYHQREARFAKKSDEPAATADAG
ncbi:type I-C CRISPR-associated protein Cas8c/Csd1 [Salinisphaera hydrothermalis]|uniref:type I-C CRISPR-associated protein Cas8c/Csd1 n=1 Tax=Salinisphaera hydrothermalis TaxID=563188 RepID=UPI00333F2F78